MSLSPLLVISVLVIGTCRGFDDRDLERLNNCVEVDMKEIEKLKPGPLRGDIDNEENSPDIFDWKDWEKLKSLQGQLPDGPLKDGLYRAVRILAVAIAKYKKEEETKGYGVERTSEGMINDETLTNNQSWKEYDDLNITSGKYSTAHIANREQTQETQISSNGDTGNFNYTLMYDPEENPFSNETTPPSYHLNKNDSVQTNNNSMETETYVDSIPRADVAEGSDQATKNRSIELSSEAYTAQHTTQATFYDGHTTDHIEQSQLNVSKEDSFSSYITTEPDDAPTSPIIKITSEKPVRYHNTPELAASITVTEQSTMITLPTETGFGQVVTVEHSTPTDQNSTAEHSLQMSTVISDSGISAHTTTEGDDSRPNDPTENPQQEFNYNEETKGVTTESIITDRYSEVNRTETPPTVITSAASINESKEEYGTTTEHPTYTYRSFSTESQTNISTTTAQTSHTLYNTDITYNAKTIQPETYIQTVTNIYEPTSGLPNPTTTPSRWFSSEKYTTQISTEPTQLSDSSTHHPDMSHTTVRTGNITISTDPTNVDTEHGVTYINNTSNTHQTLRPEEATVGTETTIATELLPNASTKQQIWLTTTISVDDSATPKPAERLTTYDFKQETTSHSPSHHYHVPNNTGSTNSNPTTQTEVPTRVHGSLSSEITDSFNSHQYTSEASALSTSHHYYKSNNTETPDTITTTVTIIPSETMTRVYNSLSTEITESSQSFYYTTEAIASSTSHHYHVSKNTESPNTIPITVPGISEKTWTSVHDPLSTVTEGMNSYNYTDEMTTLSPSHHEHSTKYTESQSNTIPTVTPAGTSTKVNDLSVPEITELITNYYTEEVTAPPRSPNSTTATTKLENSSELMTEFHVYTSKPTEELSSRNFTQETTTEPPKHSQTDIYTESPYVIHTTQPVTSSNMTTEFNDSPSTEPTESYNDSSLDHIDETITQLPSYDYGIANSSKLPYNTTAPTRPNIPTEMNTAFQDLLTTKPTGESSSFGITEEITTQPPRYEYYSETQSNTNESSHNAATTPISSEPTTEISDSESISDGHPVLNRTETTAVYYHEHTDSYTHDLRPESPTTSFSDSGPSSWKSTSHSDSASGAPGAFSTIHDSPGQTTSHRTSLDVHVHSENAEDLNLSTTPADGEWSTLPQPGIPKPLEDMNSVWETTNNGSSRNTSTTSKSVMFTETSSETRPDPPNRFRVTTESHTKIYTIYAPTTVSHHKKKPMPKAFFFPLDPPQKRNSKCAHVRPYEHIRQRLCGIATPCI